MYDSFECLIIKGLYNVAVDATLIGIIADVIQLLSLFTGGFISTKFRNTRLRDYETTSLRDYEFTKLLDY